MRHTFIVLCIIWSINLFAQEKRPIDEIFDEVQKIDRKYWNRGSSDKFTFVTVEQQKEKAREYEEQVSLLKAISSADLTNQELISRDIMLMILNDHISTVKYKKYLLTFNAEGGFYNRSLLSLGNRKFDSAEGNENYIKWLISYVDYLEYNKELLKEGIKENVVRPKVIVANALKLMQPWMEQDPEQNPFSAPLRNMPESVEGREEIYKKGIEVIKETVIPAYSSIYKFLENDYMKKAPQKEGISNIKNGQEYYEDRIRFFTTMDMSPDSVYNLGMSEVKRIRSLMEDIIKESNFEGSFADFIQFLRTDPQFFAKTPQELLNYASWLSKKAEGRLPSLFSDLYSLPFTVEPVPDAIAPTYTSGRYVSGSRENDRAGIYWVNTYDLPSRTLYTLPALTLHEAVPGHHLDYGVRAELTDIPAFRQRYYISAFGEGWGLYSEYLGEEMGMYTTSYELFGRYTYEMWRACRLVVDVGLHYKGWNRQEAVDFMAGNTALSFHEVNTEIDRYIGWPGQAVSYKIGEITIRSLRKAAEESLGDKFDIQEFHKLILKNGSVPLPILREEVNKYIEAQK